MNAARGETGLVIDGVERRLCLTLGALAEIEAGFGCVRMSELDARMRSLSAADLVIVLAALLRGGGEADAAAQLNSASVSPGAAARAVAEAFRLGLVG
ncbi:MAG: GTA-gp10 family protein [Hyphomonas sp.]|uniref:GTA-gp10 family protein n=1 Tax=Hyphomonas sp. TaxID=87 RepID=UPI003528CE60